VHKAFVVYVFRINNTILAIKFVGRGIKDDAEGGSNLFIPIVIFSKA